MKTFFRNDACFLCPCSKCKADPNALGISESLCDKLNLMQKHIKSEGFDIDLVVTSGRRCPEHNTKVGGVVDSTHTKGIAVDLKNKDYPGYVSSEINHLIVNAGMVWNIPFTRVYSTHVHIDLREMKYPKLLIGP